MPDGAGLTPSTSTRLDRLRAAFGLLGEAVPLAMQIARASDGRIVYANAAYCALMRCTEEEAVSRPWQHYLTETEPQAAGAHRRPPEISQSVQLLTCPGREIWADVSREVITLEGEKFCISSIADATPLVDAVAEVRRLADEDALTGLPNMRCLQDRLERALSRARRYDDRVGVMFVDLDGFKQVNDTIGHDAGDAVLQEVGNRLGKVVRQSDTVARRGGDEFIIMLTDVVRPADLTTVASRAVDALSRPIATEGGAVTISASIGIASYPEHGGDGEALLSLADQAMYRAKRGGKNGYHIAA